VTWWNCFRTIITLRVTAF